MKILSKNPSLFSRFKENISLKVGDGHKILFWRDKWIGEDSLMSVFPRLSSFASKKEVYLAGMVAYRVQSEW